MLGTLMQRYVTFFALVFLKSIKNIKNIFLTRDTGLIVIVIQGFQDNTILY